MTRVPQTPRRLSWFAGVSLACAVVVLFGTWPIGGGVGDESEDG